MSPLPFFVGVELLAMFGAFSEYGSAQYGLRTLGAG